MFYSDIKKVTLHYSVSQQNFFFNHLRSFFQVKASIVLISVDVLEFFFLLHAFKLFSKKKLLELVSELSLNNGAALFILRLHQNDFVYQDDFCKLKIRSDTKK